MDQFTALSNSEDRPTGASHVERSPTSGVLQTFVDLAELRRLLGRLTAAELLKMVVSETFG